MHHRIIRVQLGILVAALIAAGCSSSPYELDLMGAPAVFETTGGMYVARIATRDGSPGSAVEVARLQFDGG